MAAYVDGYPGNSGLDNTTLITNAKYFDKYSNTSATSRTSYNSRILGDATGELGPFYSYYEKVGYYYSHSSWYSDFAQFISKGEPWFVRGGQYQDGKLGSQFYFTSNHGGNNRYLESSRLVLAVK